MHCAAATGAGECSRLLLAAAAAADARTGEGWCALMGAAQDGDADTIAALLAARAPVDARRCRRPPPRARTRGTSCWS